jgi:hypothetical protein
MIVLGGRIFGKELISKDRALLNRMCATVKEIPRRHIAPFLSYEDTRRRWYLQAEGVLTRA